MSNADTAPNTARVQAALASLKTGRLDVSAFTPNARWWWNGGLDLSVAEFSDLLGILDQQVEAGIVVTPGLVIEQGDSVMVEATSHGLLKNGKVYQNRYIFLVHFKGPLIREVREYSDSAHVLATFDMPG